jgi:hypothetical protein
MEKHEMGKVNDSKKKARRGRRERREHEDSEALKQRYR